MRDPSDEIMDELAARDVHPVPRWHFLMRRSVFWSLATASVLVGATALSIAYYIFLDSDGIPTRVLLHSPLEDIVEGTPILWLIMFGLFVASAYLSVRHTKRGYRYGTAKAVALLLLVTVALGAVLSIADCGNAVHYYLFNGHGPHQTMRHAGPDRQ